jgi:hypothetical protein
VTQRAVRGLGWLAIGYGALTAAVLILAAVVGSRAIDQADELSRSAGESLAAATATIEDTAAAFEGFDASLGRAAQAAAEATLLVRSASSTMDRLAASLDISIFGARPLRPLKEDAERSADQLTAVADEVEQLTGALVANRGDVSIIRQDLERLAVRLGALHRRVYATDEGEPAGTERSIGVLRPLFIVLLLWIALQSAGSLGLGAYLLKVTGGLRFG